MSEFEEYIGLFNTYMQWYRLRYKVSETITMFDDIDEDVDEKTTNHVMEKFAEMIFTYKKAQSFNDTNIEPVYITDADFSIYQNPYILIHNDVPIKICQHILPLFIIIAENQYDTWEIRQLE